MRVHACFTLSRCFLCEGELGLKGCRPAQSMPEARLACEAAVSGTASVQVGCTKKCRTSYIVDTWHHLEVPDQGKKIAEPNS